MSAFLEKTRTPFRENTYMFRVKDVLVSPASFLLLAVVNSGYGRPDKRGAIRLSGRLRRNFLPLAFPEYFDGVGLPYEC